LTDNPELGLSRFPYETDQERETGVAYAAELLAGVALLDLAIQFYPANDVPHLPYFLTSFKLD
jgi:hypothetical protein